MTAAWGVGSVLLFRDLEARQAARTAAAVESTREAFQAAERGLLRETALLARDPAIVARVVRRDRAAPAPGESPRALAATADGLADVLVVADARGVPLVQVPVMAVTALPDLALPVAPGTGFRAVGGAVHLVALVPIRAEGGQAGLVLVGRRLEHLAPAQSIVAGRPIVVLVGGDAALGATRLGLPATGWEAATRAGGLRLDGAPWTLRQFDDRGLWALVPPAGEEAERRRLALLLTVTLSVVLVALVGAAWAGRGAREPGRPGDERAGAHDTSPAESQRLEALASLTQTLSTLPLDAVLQRVVDAAVGLVGSSVARLWLVDEDGVHVALRAEAGVQTGVAGVRRFRVGEGLAGTVAASRAPLIVSDALDDPRTRNIDRIRAEGTRSFAGVPLLVGERVVGALWVGMRERHEFTAGEIAVLQSLADQAAIAIENVRLFREERGRREQLAALLEINTRIGAAESTDVLLRTIAEEAARLTGVDNAIFRLVEGDDVVLAAAVGTMRDAPLLPRLRVGQSFTGRVVAEGRTLTGPADQVAPIIADHRPLDVRFGYTHHLGVPLRFGDRTLGVLALRARRAFTTREREVAEAFAGQAAIALEQVRLYREASRQAHRMAALADVERVLTETLDPAVVAQGIADSVCTLLETHSAALYRLEPDTGRLVADTFSKAASGPADDWPRVLQRGHGLSGLAVVQRRAQTTPDMLNDARLTVDEDLRARYARFEYLAFLAVPLVVQERILGALAIRDRTGRRFTVDDVRLAQAFADQAAIALENARLHDETDRRRREAEIVAAIAGSMNASLELDTVLERVVAGARELTGSDTARIALREPGTDRFGFRYAVGVSHSHEPTVIEPGRGAGGQVLVTGRPFRTANYLEDDRIPPDYVALVRAEGYVAQLVVPIRIGERIEGLLYVNNRTDRPFTGRDQSTLERLADHAAIAIRNAQLYQEAREYGQRLQVLDEVNRLVSSSLQMDEVLHNIAAAVARLFDAPHVSVWVVDEPGARLRRSITLAHPDIIAGLPREVSIGDAGSGQVVATGEPILWADLDVDRAIAGRDVMIEHGLRFFLSYPIAIGERVLGAFGVTRATPSPMTPESRSILASLAAQAAMALDHARLYAETTRRLEQTRALLEVTEILNSTLDSTQLLARVARRIASVGGAERCLLERWDGDMAALLTVEFADGRDPEPMRTALRRLADGPLAQLPARVRVLESRQPVVVRDDDDRGLLPPDWREVGAGPSTLMVPLIRQDHVIGALILDGGVGDAGFQPWQAELGAAIGAHLVLTLENIRLYAEAQDRLRETTTLLAVSRVLSQPGPTDDVMRRLAREVARAFGADMVGAYVLDERGEALVPLGGYHVPRDLQDLFRAHPMVLAEFPFVREAAASGRAAWSADPLADERFHADWVRRLPHHSVLFAPTRVRGVSVGGLFLVWWSPGRAFPAAEVRLLEAVAGQLGLALENAELARQREARLQEMETLLAVSRTLSTTLDFEALIDQFLEQLSRALGADAVGLLEVDDSGEWLTPLAGTRMPAELLGPAGALRLSVTRDEFYAEAARTGRPVFTTDAGSDPRLPVFVVQAVPHRSQLFAPVRVKDRLVAGFIAAWWDERRPFSDSELSLVESIAAQAGAALENARLFQQNRRQVDELSVLHRLSRAVTGQLDREALLDALRAEVPHVLEIETMDVLLVDGEAIEVALHLDHGVAQAQPNREPGPSGLLPLVLETRRAVRTEDHRGECERRGLPLPGVAGSRCWIGVPMTAGEQCLGALTVSREGPGFTAADERLMSNIADLAALALRSVRLYEERTRAYGELEATQDHLVRTEKLRALGEMASGVAHDFNNLLAAILGRAQLLLRQVEDPRLRQWLQVIERSASDGAQTVRRLQEFARVRRDQPRVPVDVNDVVRDALDITHSRWREESMRRGLFIAVETRLGAVPQVAGDPAELREAMTNLILNAVDAMPQGGTLTLTTALVEGAVEVTVADTGMGIPEDVRERIFDPFFTTKGPQGTGLGLSMTYGILSRHEARITVESEEGRGTLFRLRFPASSMALATPSAGDVAATPVSGLRCLVVDDEAAVGGVIGDVLESVGHRAVVLADGAVAIERLRAERFDVLFTDLAMPGVSGWQVAKAAQAVAPEMPVFVVTGFGVELSDAERRAHGVTRVFTKPVGIQDLVEAMREAAQLRPRTERPEESR